MRRPPALFALALSLFALTLISSSARAEPAPIAERDPAIGLEGFPPGGGASGVCTIVYHNFCSGWIWLFNGFTQGDKVGVVYDLAAECGAGPGHSCTNTGNWWYWRYTDDGYCGYGFDISYSLYEVDGDECLAGAPIGTLAGQCPLERWNYVPGLGSTAGDRVALVGEWTKGTLPYAATDNNERNANGGPDCSGIGVGNGTSYYFRNGGADLCPPTPFTDALGPIDLIVMSAWDCASTTATEPSSWTDLKALFQ